MMKKHIKKALQWALSKFEPDPSEIAAWHFPAVTEDFEPRPKRKPSLKKATTRTKAVVKKTVKKAK